MIGMGCDYPFNPWLEFFQHPRNILVLQSTEYQDDRYIGKIFIQSLSQAQSRVPVMSRVDDNRRLTLKDFETGGPFYLRKSPLNGFVRDFDPAGFEGGIRDSIVLNLVCTE